MQTNQAWAFVPSVTNAGAYTIRPYLSPYMCLSFSSQVGRARTALFPQPMLPPSVTWM